MRQPRDHDPWAEQRRESPRSAGRRKPIVVELPAHTMLWRIHPVAHAPDAFASRVPDAMRGGRFDSPGGAPGVLYAADSIEGAVAEILLRDVPLTDEGARAVPLRQVLGRVLSSIETKRALTLVSLHGPGAAAVGQGLWLTKSDSADYGLTREWGAAVRRRAPGAAGLVWRARHDEDRLAYALYDDVAAGAVQVRSSLGIGDGAGLEAVRKALLAHRAVIEGQG